MELEGIKKDFKRQLEISQRTIPSRLAISFNDGKAIGSVNSYYIDGDSKKRAVGIGICDDNYWSMGIGEKALRKWIDFWLDEQELETLYCEIWSGNIPMMKLAEKVGFVELEREKNIRRVRGKDYDGITYLYTR